MRPLGTRSNVGWIALYRSTNRPSGPATNIAVEKASPFSTLRGT
ncbi:hypothetical protein PSTAB_1904 [Stutzerimonas stutzeri]|uniref:Uncharacterized protein n=1 Tax=Stutzerimonas stutzeri (strain ATCC 17588 / DSM 5190 / CCUG 11256 / JCM 5965 / LMG 11199 / NBRC 14165 / NCIMB 11358 / Stanier 221) TaxID=96563 RepID=F8H9G3_STUS2|nr:hypothetical protein PSTAB_1904 [Stutzerimonas stutzeri]